MLPDQEGVTSAPPASSFDQSEDFILLSLDGVSRSIDVVAAHQEFAQIDVRYARDPWCCFECNSEFKPTSEELGDTELVCPLCQSKKVNRDPRWLDDVAAYVVKLGWSRCSHGAAGWFYSTVVNHINGLKKTTPEALASASGMD